MEYVTLNDGHRMPQLGFGVFQIDDLAECERAVTEALSVGYRLLDTAASYGNEEAVGRAIKASGIARDDLFVTTKLWLEDAGYDRTKRAVERSMQRLGVGYLDLYLIHQPFGDYYGSWRAMQELRAEGVLRSIGVSNFFPDRLVDLIMHNEITPAVDQIETHVFNQRTADQQVMQRYGVQIESWGPFAEGKNGFFTNEILTGIAEAHDTSIAQVALRWMLQRGVVVIPKSVRRDRMTENLDVFDFTLTDEQLSQIATLDLGQSMFFDHRDPEQVARLNSLRRDT
jgi:2,5-diketo-D-gluconate reductase A